MLHNPDWDKTKTNPLSLDAVIAWLEKQPADGKYVYSDCRDCLAAQYNASIGREYHYWPNWHIEGRQPYMPTFDRQLETIAYGTPKTFGAALDRAKKLKKTA